MLSGLLHDADEICSILGFCIAYSDNSLLTFRDNLSVPSLRVKKPKKEGFQCYTARDMF